MINQKYSKELKNKITFAKNEICIIKNNYTLIKANFIKTANFLEELLRGIFNSWIRKTKEKTNATRSTVLAFGETPVRYKIELIERDLWRN